MAKCVEDGREVTFLGYAGQFRCRVVGRTSGNVLLRLAQYDAARAPDRTTAIARAIVAAKVRNQRQTLMRGAREAKNPDDERPLREAAERMAALLAMDREARHVDDVRGLEGEAASHYFGAFGHLITAPPADFSFRFRTRRPPKDRVNALLSFLYALLRSDCIAALEGVGLDPQVGYLHAVRPGRPSLALDLMEEFRSSLVDRLALTLINRRQVKASNFDVREGAGDSVLLNENGRRAVLAAYQTRKQEMVGHPFLKAKTPFGLLPHLQARLLARHLRGDLEEYPPYLST